jgi:hypothetical protein
MTDQLFLMKDERMTTAISEMQYLISMAFPSVSYTIAHQDDPKGIQLIALVDIEDTDTVVDCFIDRLLTLQVDESIPLYVIPVRSTNRVTSHPQPTALPFAGTKLLTFNTDILETKSERSRILTTL